MKINKELLVKEYCRIKKKLNKLTETVKQTEFHENSKFKQKHYNSIKMNFSELQGLGESHFYKNLPERQKALLTEADKIFDPSATKDDVIKDLREVQKLHPFKFISRTTYRALGRYSDSTWNRYFGTFHEFKRQAGLELTRHQHAAERGIAKHAAFEHYNEYFIKNVMPYYDKYKKKIKHEGIKTMMVLSDLHDIECDEFTLEVFIDTCKRKQPDIIVLNGDIFDLYEFSRFSHDPRHIKLKERFDFIHKRLFKALRDACPNAQIDFIMGNHEFRLVRLLADQSPHLRVLLSDVVGLSFSKIFGLDKYQINWVSKVDLGAFSKADIDNEMKKNYRIYFDCFAVTHEPDAVLMRSMSGTNGHHHKGMYTTSVNANRGVISWTQTPAGHVDDAEYLSGHKIWNTGFLEVTINVEAKQALQVIHQTYKTWAMVDGMLYEKKK
jgi:hypothetical protein